MREQQEVLLGQENPRTSPILLGYIIFLPCAESDYVLGFFFICSEFPELAYTILHFYLSHGPNLLPASHTLLAFSLANAVPWSFL